MNLPHFNYDSLVLMTIVNLLTTGSVMMFIWNVDRPGPGLTQIAWADLLIGLGLLIPALRNVFPGSRAVLLCSNLALFAGVMMMWSGVRAFRGFRPTPRPLVAALSACFTGSIVYWLFVSDDIAMRVTAGSAIAVLITLATGAAMLAELPREDRRLYIFAAVLFSFHAISLFLRGGWAFTNRSNGSLILSSPPDLTSLFTLNFMVTGCCLAIATASSRRLYHSTRKLALHDPLTQLPNRRMFEERLAELCFSSRARNIALIYLDLDNFRGINETFGHAGGDEVLRTVGERLMSEFAASGFPARLGGDEFVVLIEGVESRRVAYSILDQLMQAIQREMTIGSQSVSLEVSSGMALFPEDVPSLAGLAEFADRQMYRAKRRTRQYSPLVEVRS